MKNFTIALLLSFTTFQTFSQLPCYTDEMHQEIFDSNPGIHQKIITNYNELEAFTQQYIVNHHSDNFQRGAVLYTIPIVFHVIHNYGPENISDAQILDQLRIINEDYQKRNADTANTITTFKSIAADCQIEFRLAQLDPNGNCTSGITRHVDSSTYIGDHSVKDIVHWDPTKYLNVYICAAAAGLAGHSLMPATADTIPNWDGIVIQHSYVGDIGTSNPNRSVVLTHEIGHYLNLFHTWGGNNVPGFPYLPVGDAGNCSYDDAVNDTPNTIGWSNCNLNGQSCSSLDNIQNFMEYAYCPTMFTTGQKLRMHAALNSSVAGRNNLWSNTNLTATGVDGNDHLCVVQFDVSKEKVCTGELVTYYDNSLHGVISRTWYFDGGTPATSTDSIPVVSYANAGIYNVKLVVNNNSTSDSLIINNFIEVFEDSMRPYFLVEDFEAFQNLGQSYWFANNPDDSVTFELSTNAGYNSSHSVLLNNYINPAGRADELISRPVNLTGTSALELNFKYAFAKKHPTNSDKLQVYVSNDCGSTWDIKKNIYANTLNTVTDTLSTPFAPTSIIEWNTSTVTNITSAYWTHDFMVKFVFVSDGGNNLYLDNINLLNPAQVGIPENNKPESVVYPNPSFGKVTIQASYQIRLIKVYDLQGKIVYQINPNSKQVNIDLSTLSNSLYQIQLFGEETIENKKLYLVDKK